MATDRCAQFRALHQSGTFVMPNPWDVGSARVLAWMGFPALATTSSGHAATFGRLDQHVTRDELLAHAEAVAGAVEIPLNVDAEGCFADDPGGVPRTVELIGETGAAGCSLEDYDPEAQTILPIGEATERVAAAVAAAKASGLVLTARAENHLYGHGNLDDTIARLQAYAAAGADVVYAPGLADLGDIARVVAATDRPVNVLALPRGPSVPELASVGVRRVSTGGLLTRAAYGGLVAAATELRDQGTSTYSTRAIPSADVVAAFGA
jgi:2-methylisocitrate lyase-like PEP mutase family enzyme